MSPKGVPLSAEQRAHLSAILTGRKLSPETRAKMSAVRKARTLSLDQRAKMRDDYTDERRAQMSALLKGKPRSPETIAKISSGKRGKPRPDMAGNDYIHSAPVKGECAYCLTPATGYDHVIPRSRDGSDDTENIVPCCPTCNASKSNRTPDEWLADGLIAETDERRGHHRQLYRQRRTAV